MSVDDDERSGRPATGTTTENVAKVRETIREDRRRKIHDVCNIVGLSYGTCQRILSDELNIRRKRPDKWRNNSWVLHHDNAPAHASLFVRHFLASMNTTVIPHPPYSPDLAPCDFLLFTKMKLKLKGRRFDSVEEIQTESQDVLNTLTRNDFQQCFRSWKSRWNRCINAEGDCFEGDGGK
jgi:transposase